MRTLCATVITLGLLAASARGQDPVKERLEKSPRHHEWVVVKNGPRDVHCFVVYPEVKDKATAVLVIHENKGLQTFDRGVADQLAEAGYIAIAPDLLSGLGPNGGKTSDIKSTDDATKVLYKLPQDQVTADLNAAADYIIKVPAANGKLAVCGFCWGGGQALRYATNRKDLKATFVFYGMFPHTEAELAKITAPVYGFYGENDNRINASIPKTKQEMKAVGKTYEPTVYEGAGHGFMRAGELPGASEANQKARAAAWERWKKLLKAL